MVLQDGGLYNVAHDRWVGSLNEKARLLLPFLTKGNALPLQVNVHSEFACLRQQFTPIETDWTAESAETCCTIKVRSMSDVDHNAVLTDSLTPGQIKGNYLVAEENGTINCDRTSVKHAEKFLVVPHDAVTYFTSPHGKLLDVAKKKHRRSQYVDEVCPLLLSVGVLESC